MIRRLFIFLFPILVNFLYGNEESYIPYPPEKEFEILTKYALNTNPSLSEALKELTANVIDLYYKPDFFEKLAKAEKAKFDGEYTDHWENGQIKIQATLKKGTVDGHVHGWYPNGNESFKAYYDNGKKIGVHIAFFPVELSRAKTNGSMGRYLIFNREGRLNGEQFSSSPEIYLKVHVAYKDGVLDGEKVYYNEQEKRIASWTYKKGKLISKFEDKSQTPKPS